VPIRFQVGNPAEVPRTIRLDVDLQTPTGLEGVKLALDTSPKTLVPTKPVCRRVLRVRARARATANLRGRHPCG